MESEVIMQDGVIMGLLAFVVAILAIIKPIINLNSNIVELNTTLKQFEKTTKENHQKLEARVAGHEEKIDDLNKAVATHDVRIKSLEGK